MRRWSILILLLLASPARAATISVPGTISRQDADDVAITGGSIGPAVAGSSEVYGAGWDSDLGFATKNDVFDKLDASIGTGVGINALPHGTIVRAANGGDWTISSGGTLLDELVIGPIDLDTGNVETSGPHILFRSAGAPTVFLYDPIFDGTVDAAAATINGDDTGSISNMASVGTATLTVGGVSLSTLSANGVTLLGHTFAQMRSDIGALASADIDTSAELAAILGDENGSTGGFLRAAGTAVIASGKTFTASNTWTSTATDGATVVFGAGGTVLYSTAIGATVQGFDSDLTTWSGITPNATVATAIAATPNTGSGLVTVNGTATLTAKTLDNGTLSGGLTVPDVIYISNSSTNSFQIYSDASTSAIGIGHSTRTPMFRMGGSAGSFDCFIAREGPATIQFGIDAATTIAQTIKGNDDSSGDGPGGNVTIAGGRNLGASTEGKVIIQVPATASTGVAGVLGTIATFDRTGLVVSGGSSGLQLTKTNDVTGGDRTINKQCGSFIVSESDNAVTITNSYVSTGSVVVCQVATNNGEFLTHEVSQGAGSFVFTFSAAVADDTRVNFVVMNGN